MLHKIHELDKVEAMVGLSEQYRTDRNKAKEEFQFPRGYSRGNKISSEVPKQVVAG